MMNKFEFPDFKNIKNVTLIANKPNKLQLHELLISIGFTLNDIDKYSYGVYEITLWYSSTFETYNVFLYENKKQILLSNIGSEFEMLMNALKDFFKHELRKNKISKLLK